MEYLILSNGSFITTGEEMFAGIAGSDWPSYYPVMSDGNCKWVMRSLFLQSGERRILIDTGPGDKLSPSLIRSYGMANLRLPTDLLRENGVDPATVTDVILTHLHFDHCGGTTIISSHGLPVPSFSNAMHHISRKQWDYAHNPEIHDQESYLKDDFRILENHKINLIEKEGALFPGFNIRFYDGHTPGQMIPFIKMDGYTLVFAADLLPSAAHIREGFVMSYDLNPGKSEQEKNLFLEEAATNEYRIVFQHDIGIEQGIIAREGDRFVLIPIRV
jgi:glyoxylase-like metal-dependent hydrolase (beta-lactamase superfamily II)